MADIKTRDAIKGMIKQIDKAAVAADHMRSANVQTKTTVTKTVLYITVSHALL